MTAIRVLLVDDDALVRDLVTRGLGSDEFEVAVAPGVNDIVPIAEAFAPDAVLVDVNIPGTTTGGVVEVARAVVPPPARIFLFSADDEPVLRTLARRVGADGWLSKSTPVVDLGAHIRRLLNR